MNDRGIFQLVTWPAYTEKRKYEFFPTRVKSITRSDTLLLSYRRFEGAWPLTPNSDQHQISPCNIKAYSTPEVMRIKDVITQGEFS